MPLCIVQPAANVATNSPSGAEYIPYINIGMEFTMDLAVFNYQLAQQIASVVLSGVPASSYMDATVYTEEGSTPQTQTVRITVKFYDGDSSQSNALLTLAPNLVSPSGALPRLHHVCHAQDGCFLIEPWNLSTSLAALAPNDTCHRGIC